MPNVLSQVRSIKSNYMFKTLRTTGRSALQMPRLRAATDMTTTTKAGDEEEDDHGVQRRKGVFHPNLWDDDFLQSLSTDYYGQASYSERVERLIEEVKQMFTSIWMGDGEQLNSPYTYGSIDGSSRPQFSQTIDWILLNQLQDGSWPGSESELSLSHRLVVTLACVITLVTWKIEPVQIEQCTIFYIVLDQYSNIYSNLVLTYILMLL